MGLLISLGCIAILLKQVDLKQSWNALARLNGPLMLLPLILFLVNLPLRAWRWQLIFPSSWRPGFGVCLTVLGIGNMANFLLPWRAGDLARCVLLQPNSSLAAGSRTLATLAVEKVLDGLALVGIVLLTVWTSRPPLWVRQLLAIALLIWCSALIFLVVVRRYRSRVLLAWLRRVFRMLRLSPIEEKLDGLFVSFTEGLSAVSSGRQMAVLAAITAAIWTTEAALVWGLGIALGLALPFRWAAATTANLGLGLMIPASPGGLGTYELVGTETLKLAGIAASSALTLTIVIHAWVFVSNIAFGICSLAIRGVSLAQLRNRLELDAGVETSAQSSL